jgi:hypothetical protein
MRFVGTLAAKFRRLVRRGDPERVRFVTLERAFKPRRATRPQVRVRALRDLNGWVNRSRKEWGKWSLPAGGVGRLDEEKAREFARKGHVEILDSEDEA